MYTTEYRDTDEIEKRVDTDRQKEEEEEEE